MWGTDEASTGIEGLKDSNSTTAGATIGVESRFVLALQNDVRFKYGRLQMEGLPARLLVHFASCVRRQPTVMKGHAHFSHQRLGWMLAPMSSRVWLGDAKVFSC